MVPSFKTSLQMALGVAVLGMGSASTTYEGYGTVYTLTEPSSGNCNFMSAPTDATTKYAALNADQWDKTMNCGRCAEVTCTDASCSGQSSEVVYIMDQCPGCEYGDLDLSPDVFESITGQSYTKLSIEWKFVDCPISNNVQYCLKTGSSEFWVAVQPANFVSGVQSLSINGQETTVIDSAYYFLIDGSGESVADLSSVSISLTGVNGQVLEETLSLSADECTDGSSQFTSSGDVSQSTTTTQTSTSTAAPTSAPSTAAPTPVPTTEAPKTVTPPPVPTSTPTETPTSTQTATPTPTPTTTSSPTTSSVASSSGNSSHVGSGDSNSTSASTPADADGSSKTKPIQVSDASRSTSVQVKVTTKPSVESAPVATPEDTVQSNVQSSGGSHSTPLMIGMIVLVCAAVAIVVALAVYVRHRKRQIDSYKRREEQATEMSDEEMSPRASDVSAAYDIVRSPTVDFSLMAK